MTTSLLTTDGQSASLFWRQATIRTRKQFLFQFHGKYLQIFAVFFLWGSLSDERTGL
jgi:hypothetical protein